MTGLEAFIFFGAEYLIAVMAAALAFCAFRMPFETQRRLAILALISFLLAYLLARVAGLFYAHPQPFVAWEGEPLIPHEIDNAFPSDHMLLASAMAAVGLLINRWLGAALFVAAALVGIARVAAGLHAWVDIAASVALACAAVWVTQAFLKRVWP